MEMKGSKFSNKGDQQSANFQLSGVCLLVENFEILFLDPLAEVFCEHLQFSDQKSIEIQENLSQIWKKV